MRILLTVLIRCTSCNTVMDRSGEAAVAVLISCACRESVAPRETGGDFCLAGVAVLIGRACRHSMMNGVSRARVAVFISSFCRYARVPFRNGCRAGIAFAVVGFGRYTGVSSGAGRGAGSAFAIGGASGEP